MNEQKPNLSQATEIDPTHVFDPASAEEALGDVHDFPPELATASAPRTPSADEHIDISTVDRFAGWQARMREAYPDQAAAILADGAPASPARDLLRDELSSLPEWARHMAAVGNLDDNLDRLLADGLVQLGARALSPAERFEIFRQAHGEELNARFPELATANFDHLPKSTQDLFAADKAEVSTDELMNSLQTEAAVQPAPGADAGSRDARAEKAQQQRQGGEAEVQDSGKAFARSVESVFAELSSLAGAAFGGTLSGAGAAGRAFAFGARLQRWRSDRANSALAETKAQFMELNSQITSLLDRKDVAPHVAYFETARSVDDRAGMATARAQLANLLIPTEDNPGIAPELLKLDQQTSALMRSMEKSLNSASAAGRDVTKMKEAFMGSLEKLASRVDALPAVEGMKERLAEAIRKLSDQVSKLVARLVGLAHGHTASAAPSLA